MKPRHHHLTGIALTIAALVCFTLLDATSKYVTLSLPVLMALWFRYLFHAITATAILLPLHGRRMLYTVHPKYQALRGVLLLTNSTLAVLSLKFMPMAEFTAIVMVTPLVVTLLAASTLGEKVTPLRWVLVVGGFIGTLIIVRPGTDMFNWTMLIPLGLVASNTWFQILTSQLARSDSAVTMHFYTGWMGLLLTSLALPFFWTMPDTPTLWACLLLLGILGTAGHLLLSQSYRRAPATTLTPFHYLQIGFSMLAGWLVFSHLPDRWSLIGMLLIATCGVAGAWLAMYENRMPIKTLEA